MEGVPSCAGNNTILSLKSRHLDILAFKLRFLRGFVSTIITDETQELLTGEERGNRSDISTRLPSAGSAVSYFSFSVTTP